MSIHNTTIVKYLVGTEEKKDRYDKCADIIWNLSSNTVIIKYYHYNDNPGTTTYMLSHVISIDNFKTGD